MVSTPTTSTPACTHGFIKATCGDCHLKNLCLPLAMDIKDIGRLDKIIQRSSPIHVGDHLYRSGEAFRSIYAVRSGSLKTYIVDDNGVEQVTGFFLPGEVLGFDGIGSKTYAGNVMALETSMVCEIPFYRIEELSLQIASFQRHIFELMSLQIQTVNKMMLTLSKKNAQGRIATFLICLSQRFSRRNLSPNAIRLPMSRLDIGNYLGLTIETVSRTFSRLHKEHVLSVDGREVVIKDHVRLNQLCHSA